MRCDCHVHIVGPIGRYPQLAARTYQAGLAALSTLRGLAEQRDIGRFVVVQPSFYEHDNTLLLESLDALGGRGRGVAVLIPQQNQPEMLADWARRGVRGLRVNLYSAAGKAGSFDRAFSTTAEIARAMNWHVEVIAPLALLVRHAGAIEASPVPIVIDHYGVYGSATPVSSDGLQLLALLRLPQVWIKLSAPYRVSGNALETRPSAAWLAAIVGVARERCVWGSDWPHTPPHEDHKGGTVEGIYRPLSYARLVDDFLAALGSAALAKQIMEVNPARLYEFADTA